jgi:hypothetical protein
MIWNLSCRKTRRLLALSAGNDFEILPSAETQRHLAICPHCRETWQGLRRAQQVLERVSATRVAGESPAVSDQPGEATLPASVWPGVARHLSVIDNQWAASDWRGWLPTAALAAACLAVIVVTIPDSNFNGGIAQNRRPLVIYPQHASTGANGLGFRYFPRASFVDSERDLPELDQDHSVQFLPADDEPRSF